MKLKLKNLRCSMKRYSKEKGSYEEQINLSKSPWYIYLQTKDTNELLKNFKEISKHPCHPNNYHYPIEDFEDLKI